jgi:hypothetical protein
MGIAGFQGRAERGKFSVEPQDNIWAFDSKAQMDALDRPSEALHDFR